MSDGTTLLLAGGAGLLFWIIYQKANPASTTLTTADQQALLQASGGNPVLAAQAAQQMQANLVALAKSDPQGAADYNCSQGQLTNCFTFSDPANPPGGTDWLIANQLNGVGRRTWR